MNAWQLVWFIGVYLAVLACLVSMVRIGLASGWWEGLKQFLFFASFAVAEWLIESWANARAPFYSYPQNIFPDMVPHFPFPASVISDAVLAHPCVQMTSPAVTATIPLAGAVIIYCLLWTGRQLLAGLWLAPLHPMLVPFMVGIAALALDLYLDPALAVSYACDGLTVQHSGLGYWEWFSSRDLADVWFNIPIFNYACWFAAPALIAAVVVLIDGNPTGGQAAILRWVAVVALGVVTVTSPGANVPWVQILVVAATVLTGLGFVIRNWAGYKRDNPFRWEFVLPMLFLLLYPLAAILFASAVSLTPLLLVAALLFCTVGILFTLSPYLRWP